MNGSLDSPCANPKEKVHITITVVDGGYALMNGKIPARTPLGFPLVLPNEGLAAAVAAEWAGQGQKVNKALLRLTPLVCVAIDLANQNLEAVLADVVPYIDTDLVCYRAGDIEELFIQQHTLLEPILAWAKERFDIALVTTGGLMPVAQPSRNRQLLTDILAAHDSWNLAAFAAAVKLLGSAVLALALLEGRLSAQEVFALAHLEEAYETQKWGKDEEKEKLLGAKKEDIQSVETFLRLLKSGINN